MINRQKKSPENGGFDHGSQTSQFPVVQIQGASMVCQGEKSASLHVYIKMNQSITSRSVTQYLYPFFQSGMVVSGQASVLDEKKTLSRMRRSAVHLGDDKK